MVAFTASHTALVVAGIGALPAFMASVFTLRNGKNSASSSSVLAAQVADVKRDTHDTREEVHDLRERIIELERTLRT